MNYASESVPTHCPKKLRKRDLKFACLETVGNKILNIELISAFTVIPFRNENDILNPFRDLINKKFHHSELKQTRLSLGKLKR